MSAPLTTTAPALRCAIYVRISEDDGSAKGVGRQEEDCRKLAASRGWPVAHVYVDNDVSASNGKVRPQYQALLRAIEHGEIDALVVWDVDRLTRTPRELEDIIELADRHSLALGNVGGEIDLSTPQGRMMARIKGTVARHEIEQMSRRIRRQSDQRAANGSPHGPVSYGFQRVDGRDIVFEPEAAIVRELARRILAGDSLRSIAADLRSRGVTPPRAEWKSQTIRVILTRPSIAGMRKHRGTIVGETNGEAVLDRDTFDRLTAFFNSPSRKIEGTGRPACHLLTGIAVCGICGGKMRVIPARVTTKGYQNKAAYNCRDCFKTYRDQASVDALVSDLITARLSAPEFIAGFSSGDGAAETDARNALAAIDAKLDNASDAYADGTIELAQLARITERLRTERERFAAALADAMPRTLPAILSGDNPADRWATAPLEVRRTAVDALMTVTILPAGGARFFKPESVGIAWR